MRGTHVRTLTSASLDVHISGGDKAFFGHLGDELIGCNGDEGGELTNSNASCNSRPLI
jgi:hypothetical protein